LHAVSRTERVGQSQRRTELRLYCKLKQ
jgi:hypothetical protein